MRKLKIGYWPLSQSLSSPGDRRRLVFWAEARGHTIITDLTKNVDVIVASENSDFNSPYFFQKQIPVIFDLVDAYLSPLNPYDDLARGFAKKLSKQISGGIKPFSHHVRDFCIRSNAVICSSLEQEVVINAHNTNTHVILDSHDEVPFLTPQYPIIKTTNRRRVLWEGQPATLRGVKQIATVLTQLSQTNDLQFNFVPDERYLKFLNRYVERTTLGFLEESFGKDTNFINIVPWTPGNLVEYAQRSEVAMIPIDLSIPMQRLKPENRLLIMWRLGLACLTSPSPAYIRVAHQAGVTATCNNNQEWLENFSRILKDPDFAHSEVLRGQNYLREYHNKTILLNKWDLAFDSVVG